MSPSTDPRVYLSNLLAYSDARPNGFGSASDWLTFWAAFFEILRQDHLVESFGQFARMTGLERYGALCDTADRVGCPDPDFARQALPTLEGRLRQGLLLWPDPPAPLPRRRLTR